MCGPADEPGDEHRGARARQRGCPREVEAIPGRPKGRWRGSARRQVVGVAACSSRMSARPSAPVRPTDTLMPLAWRPSTAAPGTPVSDVMRKGERLPVVPASAPLKEALREMTRGGIGMTVTFTAEIIAVNDRRVQFRVEARDEKEKIGEGTHERAIINIAKFATRLAEKLK